MPDISASELVAWALIAGGTMYGLLTWLGQRAPTAMVGGILAALAAKTALIELI